MTINNEADVLLAAAKAHDQSALVHLCEELRPWLRAVVSRKLNGVLVSSIDDIVQVTIVKAHRGFESFQGHRLVQFKAWLKTIAWRQIQDERNRPREINGLIPDMPRGSTSPSGKARKKEEHEIVLSHLARLPSLQREIVKLRFFEDLKFQEIAERLGKKLDVVTGQYRRAMERLRLMLRTKLGEENDHGG